MSHALADAAKFADLNPLPHQDVGQVLQNLVDRLAARLYHAQQEVDKLRPEQLTVMTAMGPIDHHWIRAEDGITARLSRLLVDIERNDLAERMVRVEEAKAMMMVRAIQMAAEQVGISRDQVRALGPAIRDQLALLQGGAPEHQRMAL
jgi:hypothetical protein